MPDREPASGSWKQRVTNVLRRLGDAILPPRCAGCGRGGALLCGDCMATLPLLEGPSCARCSRPARQPLLRCRTCHGWPAGLLTVRAACHFQEPVPRIIHQFKYEGQFGLGRPLGQLLARQWRPLSPAVDVVVPIPLHPDRRRTRGYNQSTLLVQSLCETMEWTHQVGALERVRHTRPQVGLDAHERRQNMRKAFRVTAEAAVRDRHILLIDDVCTTGATLVAAAQALLDAGARTVSGYCVARAR